MSWEVESQVTVAIPSNRVNVSNISVEENVEWVGNTKSCNPLKSGQCFQHFKECLPVCGWKCSMLQSPQIGSMFPTVPLFCFDF